MQNFQNMTLKVQGEEEKCIYKCDPTVKTKMISSLKPKDKPADCHTRLFSENSQTSGSSYNTFNDDADRDLTHNPDQSSSNPSSYTKHSKNNGSISQISISSSISQSQNSDYIVSSYQPKCPTPPALYRRRRHRGSHHSAFRHMPFDQKLDVRATQRTFEGAYLRNALGQLSFALVILKLFSKEFLPIGTVFTAQGIVILLIAWYRRQCTTRKLVKPYIQVYQELARRMSIAAAAQESMDFSIALPNGQEIDDFAVLEESENGSDYENDEEENDDDEDEDEEEEESDRYWNEATGLDPKLSDYDSMELQIQETHFDTSGPTVVLVSVWSIITYITLLVLINRLE